MLRAKFPKKLRFLPPIVMFVMTMFFVYLCNEYCFTNLYKQKYTNLSVFLGSFFMFSLVMWLWGYFSMLFGDPGTIEKEKKYCPNEKCNVRCITCKSYKPLRTHHCSTCNKCYARLDHHCIAFGRCVALRNHKVFLVFMLHSINLCFLWFIATVATIALCSFDEQPRILGILLIASASLTFLLCFLMYEEVESLMSGETTFEKIFDIHIKQHKTKKEYIEEIMGPFGYGWLVPTHTPITTTAYQWEHLRNE